MLIKLRRAQASLEYAALIGVVVGAIIIMSTYLNRSMQGKMKKESDDIGDQYDLNSGGSRYSSTMTDTDTTYTEMGTTGSAVEGAAAGIAGWINPQDTGEAAQYQATTQAGTRTVTDSVANDEGQL